MNYKNTLNICLQLFVCLSFTHAHNALANASTGLVKGSLAPVEKVSPHDLAALHTAEIAALVNKKQAIKAIERSILGPAASPVLTSLSQLKKAGSSVNHVNHPKLTTLGEVSRYVAALSLRPESTVLSELHASVNVLTPLSQFDVVSSLAIDIRVSSLTPLSGYSMWDSLVIDPRTDLASLVQLESAPSIFIDRRASVLTPLASFGFESEAEAIEYVTLADASSGLTLPKLYLGGYRASLTTQAFYDDNIFSSSTRPQGSFVLLNSLDASASLKWRGSSLDMNYTYNDGRYETSPEDNYSDGELNINFSQSLAYTGAISVKAKSETVHEARGSGVSEGTNGENLDAPLTARRDNVIVAHNYGKGGRLSLDNILAFNTLKYAGSSELTKRREYSNVTFTNGVKYRIGARTSLSAGAAVSEVDYRFNPVPVAGVEDSLNSKTKTLSLGLEREFGGSSLGHVRYGTIGRSFLDEDRESADSGYWNAGFVWAIKSYSRISLGVSRNYIESRGVGDFIDSQEHKVAWAHAWAKRLSTQINVRLTEDDYVGSGRQDQRLDAGLRVTYKFNSRLSLIGGGKYHELQSGGSDLDFKRRVVFIESNFRL